MRSALASGLKPQEAAQKAGIPPFKSRDMAVAADAVGGKGHAGKEFGRLAITGEHEGDCGGGVFPIGAVCL